MIGLFFIKHSPREMEFGEIIRKVNEDTLLVRYDPSPQGSPVKVYSFLSISRVIHDEDYEAEGIWEFFETREDLEKHVVWLQQLEETRPKIVKLRDEV